MHSLTSTIRVGPWHLTRAAAGALSCVVAVLGYSGANACMNQLSLMKCLPTWAICNKELITVLAIGPWLLLQARRGRSGFPRGRALAMLIAAGLGTELIGNIGVQWGYQVVGLSVMVPGYTACMVVASALLGGILLGERVSARNLAAVGLLVVALALLGISSVQVGPTAIAKPPASPWAIAAALALAAAAGTVFASMGIAIRHCVSRTTSYSAAMVIITGTGVLTLAP